MFDRQAVAGDTPSTFLSEARKLVWHSWMLVVLQITAFRTILKVCCCKQVFALPH